MAVVIVRAGSCGFISRIEAKPLEGRRASLAIASDCPNVTALAGRLAELGLRDVLTRGWGQGPVFAAAAETLAHNACPVPAGLIKAVEVALGLNVPAAASIEFEEDQGRG